MSPIYPREVKTPEQCRLFIDTVLEPSADSAALDVVGNKKLFVPSKLPKVVRSGEVHLGQGRRREIKFTAEKLKLPELTVVYTILIRACMGRIKDTEIEKVFQSEYMISTKDGVVSNQSHELLIENEETLKSKDLNPIGLFTDVNTYLEAGHVSRIVRGVRELGLFKDEIII